MGMFDKIRCLVPLPDGWNAGELQTKDFEEPYLEDYTIDTDLRLYKEAARYDDGSGNERKDLNFHGDLNFYGMELDNTWHEYNAIFTDGKLVEIREVRKP